MVEMDKAEGAAQAVNALEGERAEGLRSYLPHTDDPSASLDKVPEHDTRPPADRIAELLERMQPAKRILRGLLEYCREERTAEEVSDEVGRLRAHDFSVYDAPALCSLLQRAGAMRMVKTERLEPRDVEEGGVRYIQPAGAEQVSERWVTTAAGLAALEDDGSALGRFWKMLDENARYEHVYRVVLTCCANEGGATVKQLSDAVDGDPEVQEPRLYAQYFLNGLAD